MKSSEFIAEGEDQLNGVLSEIRFMPTDDLTPEENMRTQQSNMNNWLASSPGKTAVDWAKWFLGNSKPRPVEVSWQGFEGWTFRLIDGHHRLLACQTLGMPIRVELTAHNVSPHQYRAVLAGYKDVGFDPKTGKTK